MRKLLLAFQFLTIIPVKEVRDVSGQEMGSTSALFPVVGFSEGIILSLSATLLLKVVPAEPTNALIVLFLVILNGGLHLDGLADTFDALASRGDSEKKRAIMKDSTVGPMGVISIVMALLLKYVLLNAVFIHSSLPLYLTTVLLMPVMSRWAMVPAAYYSKPAGGEGLGRTFIEHTGKKELVKATIIAIVFVALVCALGFRISLFMFYAMFSMPLLYAFSFGAVWFFQRHFDGMTGDSFGAVHELATLMFLMMIVINNTNLR